MNFGNVLLSGEIEKLNEQDWKTLLDTNFFQEQMYKIKANCSKYKDIKKK
jgi:hypothetical protein